MGQILRLRRQNLDQSHVFFPIAVGSALFPWASGHLPLAPMIGSTLLQWPASGFGGSWLSGPDCHPWDCVLFLFGFLLCAAGTVHQNLGKSWPAPGLNFSWREIWTVQVCILFASLCLCGDGGMNVYMFALSFWIRSALSGRKDVWNNQLWRSWLHVGMATKFNTVLLHYWSFRSWLVAAWTYILLLKKKSMTRFYWDTFARI